MLTHIVKRYSLFMAGVCLLASCATAPVYTGTKYKKTNHVDVYTSFDSVKRDYTVIGHLEARKYAPDILKKNLAAYGEKIGADAIVITGFDVAAYKENAVVLKYKAH
jgi:hypothetical protein